MLRLFFVGKQQFTEAELESSLKMATMWCFDKIREIVIKRLEALKLTPSRKLNLAQSYNINRWFIPEIKHLVVRDECLTLDEAKEIGLDLTVMIARVRDLHYKRQKAQSILVSFTGESLKLVRAVDVITNLNNKQDCENAMKKELDILATSNGWNE